MSEITLRKIVDEITIIKKAPYKQMLVSSGITGNGAGAVSTIPIAIIPYKLWRVINVGFVVTTAGASTVAEKVSIGLLACDIGPDTPYRSFFGECSQDVTAGEQWVAGDMAMRDQSISFLADTDALNGGGVSPWAAGVPDYLNKWITKQGILSISKEQVASSTALVMGWAIIEIGEVE